MMKNMPLKNLSLGSINPQLLECLKSNRFELSVEAAIPAPFGKPANLCEIKDPKCSWYLRLIAQDQQTRVYRVDEDEE